MRKWGLALLLVGVAAGTVVLVWPRNHYEQKKIHDLNNVKQLCGLLAGKDVPLAPDGRLDVYWLGGDRILREGQEGHDLFYSRRFRRGPSAEEIEAGDYTNFVYQRHRGKVTRRGAPLLWDKEPSPQRTRMVGFSDGLARILEEDEFRSLLERYGQEP